MLPPSFLTAPRNGSLPLPSPLLANGRSRDCREWEGLSTAPREAIRETGKGEKWMREEREEADIIAKGKKEHSVEICQAF